MGDYGKRRRFLRPQERRVRGGNGGIGTTGAQRSTRVDGFSLDHGGSRACAEFEGQQERSRKPVLVWSLGTLLFR